MCDYCDCRLHPAIAELSEDHGELLATTGAIRRAIDRGDDLQPLVDRLEQLLVPHAAREERGIFAALRRAGIDDYVARFEAEHDDLHELLGAGYAANQVLAVVDLLEDHIEREETDLFPAARQLLSPSDWDDVALGRSAA